MNLEGKQWEARITAQRAGRWMQSMIGLGRDLEKVVNGRAEESQVLPELQKGRCWKNCQKTGNGKGANYQQMAELQKGGGLLQS